MDPLTHVPCISLTLLSFVPSTPSISLSTSHSLLNTLVYTYNALCLAGSMSMREGWQAPEIPARRSRRSGLGFLWLALLGTALVELRRSGYSLDLSFLAIVDKAVTLRNGAMGWKVALASEFDVSSFHCVRRSGQALYSDTFSTWVLFKCELCSFSILSR